MGVVSCGVEWHIMSIDLSLLVIFLENMTIPAHKAVNKAGEVGCEYIFLHPSICLFLKIPFITSTSCLCRYACIQPTLSFAIINVDFIAVQVLSSPSDHHLFICRLEHRSISLLRRERASFYIYYLTTGP